METLINDLLTYSRISTRGKPLTPTNSGAVLERVLANLRLAIQEAGAKVTHGPLPVVRADDSHLELLQKSNQQLREVPRAGPAANPRGCGAARWPLAVLGARQRHGHRAPAL